jgi:hypothetical protein
MSEKEKLDCKIQGAEEVLSILISRGTIKKSEGDILLEPYNLELEKLLK